ncbi:xanthine dehydrogenase family protein molybdopterin-binding subunit [Burkholderia multivorans]|uniref:xanthine dehydrogenase family protein molybdopterin-binding subunit n=1 Tax=Burkholderia multivorans TaxID=87883 RepID=UPI0019D2E41D|nr:molybdopterin cofactor-binding domain-containing protein [Burkholderia multivorans]MBN6728392.1 xanthine dehydrogenase family protein molybdopterin-binding subunit [Burkholderia multivorans]MBN6737902.1 xanthine dehydrogenase family protein molybdopterin-binding subunit [Burkholderia multivorans]MBN7128664.1 xanthine dehydrogenase family protein molybdopterin-binding subunit [Burkholderia multivorans]MBN8162672.1 xanthine dehydrogenase family protein molybdopterin-binding subunit [Burkholder
MSRPADVVRARVVPSASRRVFLKGGVALAGSLLLPLAIGDVVHAAGDGARFREINDWVRVDADGRTIIGLSQAEVGQGVYTGLPQVLADEMDADWRSVTIEFVTGRDAYRIDAANEAPQQFVGASMSATMFYTRLRIAGAQARSAFLRAGAARLGVRDTQCVTRDGCVVHPPSGRSLSYGALVDDAAKLPHDPQPKLKPTSAHTLIGRPLHKLDVPAKVDGSAIYGIDVQVPGMLVGALAMAPTLNGRPSAVHNRNALRAMPGVVDVVLAKDAVIVVAQSYWQAKKACDAADIAWDAGTTPPFDSATILAQRKGALQAPHAVVATHIGEPARKLAEAGTVVEADYHTPYIVHATMEPVNATVHVRADEIEVWGPIQGQDKVRWTLSSLFGVPAEKVIVNTTFLGGSFGRKYVPDFVVHAAVASKAVGRPVKVIRSREDDIRHGFYRPCASARLRAALGSDGLPVALHARVAGHSLYAAIKRDRYDKAGGWDETMLDGLYDLCYDVPNLLVDSVTVMQPIPVSFMRSVGSTSSVFFLESFVNELAHTVRADPVRYRRALLKHDALALRVLDATAARANWFGRAPAGVSRGVAYSLYTGRGGAFSTYVATIAEVRVTGGSVKVERIVCGIDCGRAINPLLIREMVEGGVGFALTNTFRSEITFEHGAVVQRNFADYPLLGLAAMPRIEVVIVDSDRDPQGCGEVALPPVAPAVADAIWRATGQRPRSMPFDTPLAT